MAHSKPMFPPRSAMLAATLLAAVAAAMPSFARGADRTLAPPLELPTAQGRISLADLRGKVVLLDFWASWCGPCRQSFPWMNEMQSRYQSRGFEVVAVNLDQQAQDARQFLSQIPAEFTVAYDPDGETPAAYEVMGMPSAYLIDRQGRIHSQHIGFHKDQKDRYEAEIRSLLQATPDPS